MSYKKPKILFIKGITIEDCKRNNTIYDPSNINNHDDTTFTSHDPIRGGVNLNDIGNNTMNFDNLIPPTIKYDKLPLVFTDIDEWPNKCNLRCLHSGLKTNSKPFFIPDGMFLNKEDNTINYTVWNGIFFSNPSHAFEYLVKNFPKDKQKERILMIESLIPIFYNKKIHPIPFLNSPSELEIHGGGTTIPEYEKHVNKYYEIKYVNE